MKKIFLTGPYGNLTSLYTGIFAAHPDIVGLNHGRDELPDECNFFSSSEGMTEKLASFSKHVCNSSKDWDNHARKNGTLSELERVGSFLTEKPKFIFWKESGWLTSHLRQLKLAEQLLDNDPGVYLIRPIRDPVRCLITNVNNRHYLLYDDPVRGGDISGVWESYLPWNYEDDAPEVMSLESLQTSGVTQFMAEWWVADLLWHINLAKKYPEQVLLHFEDDPFSLLLEKIGISASNEWAAAAETAAHNIIKKDLHPEVLELFKTELRKSLMWHRNPVCDKVVSQFLQQ